MRALDRVVLLAVGMALLTQPAFALRERTIGYYGYVYGSNGDYCTCKISPCGYDDLLGEKTFYCDGSTSSWGITEGCFTRIETTYGEICYAFSADAGTTLKDSAAAECENGALTHQEPERARANGGW